MSSPLVVDARGQRCPLPIVALAKAMAGAAPGEVIELLADDPAADADVPAWCRLRAQDYLGASEGPAGSTAYRIRRRAAQAD